VKEQKEQNKVTSAISAKCRTELGLLSEYMNLTLQETVKYVLEKNVSTLYIKAAQKHLKSIENNMKEEE
jgi:hypothetical protein